MNYPFWDVPTGYGILMATIAVAHVFISHFAIGGGLYLVLFERSARRRGDAARLDYLVRMSRFFAMTTLVLGALTGVAIWFVIGLLSPAATEVLIRTFVWGWAAEWSFFAIEIAAAIIYYHGWKTMTPRAHMTVGWIYFVAAWVSLFIINGILTFMLTPGKWLTGGGFWAGFFNPGFWPSLLFRTGICMVLAGFYAMLVASRLHDSDLKRQIARHNAVWSFVGLVVAAPGFYWYWRAIPADLLNTAVQHLRTPFFSLNHFYALSGAAFLVLVILSFLMARRLHIAGVVVLMVLALGALGSFEWFRESLRKPWVIQSVMYANGIEPGRIQELRNTGMLAAMPFRTGDDGADLFRRNCRTCHTIGGYKSLKPAFDGTDAAFITATVKEVHLLKGRMPPFAGTAEEAAKLGAWIHERVDRRPLQEIYGLSDEALGRKVFEVRCGKCHVPGGVGDKTASLTGLTASDIGGVLDSAADLGEGMPAFTANEAERKALIGYIETFGKGGSK